MPRAAGSGTHYRLGLLDKQGNVVAETALPSVTSIIDAVVAKPKLQYWIYKEAVDGFSHLLEKFGDKLPTDVESIRSLMASEKRSPFVQRNEAGRQGTAVHEALEALCEGKKPRRTKANAGLLDWWELRGLSPDRIIASEAPVFSLEKGYAGTLDLIYETEDGRPMLCDLKTSKQIHLEHQLQLAAYEQAWLEMNPDAIFYERTILQVRPKGNGDGELDKGYREVYADDVAISTWNHVLEVYKGLPWDWMPEEVE